MSEEWKDVAGSDGLYQVSNTGIVRKSNGKVLNAEICKGYKRVNLVINGKRKHFFVHRLVATAFVQNPNGYPQINHKDENPLNNRYDNLEWCDAKYNLNYGNRRGKAALAISGERNVLHKLTNRDVIEIRKSYIPYHSTFGQTAMARKYGVSQSTIRKALIGEKWKHV